ncbi:MAG: epoxyqueuosine reductase, partial [Defluviitaleaceae bacterium]|nr:epoxyqueuosine reductase [Defluviitaleaceae bacterium]
IRALECPVPDRLAAAKAGLGKFGRNNFIYHPEHGSYIWIDTWVTDKELDYDALADDIYVNACNDNCHKCIRACPTKALCGSLSMDFGRCVTQLQCSGKDRPDDKTMARMGQWLYGCDACQDACPLNKYKFTDTAEFPLLSEIGEYLKLETILEMDEDTYLNIIYPRFWYMGKEGLWLWKCNALRSMVNSGETGYHGLIKKYCDHEDKRVSETAQWGCGKLGI